MLMPLLFSTGKLNASDIDLNAKWQAFWIACPDNNATGYGVYHFRKEFDVGELPSVLLINVSADNRYRLFVNGKAVGMGPARGDLLHWYYETIDIAAFLKTGKI
uniref:CAZy families GH78 protein n=1 Tax=uncultured Candidatus Solibacter sp. TaxID=708629 RepID=A0A060CB55_9BACT|nr:CAZy families GH78 protein [uncultured Candidatus Solibacter sp.]